MIRSAAPPHVAAYTRTHTHTHTPTHTPTHTHLEHILAHVDANDVLVVVEELSRHHLEKKEKKRKKLPNSVRGLSSWKTSWKRELATLLRFSLAEIEV